MTALLLGWAMERPIVQILRNHLPSYGGQRARLPPGLYSEMGPSPLHRGKSGEMRLSVVRIHAVTDAGYHVLLAQLHVTSTPFAEGGEDRRVRYYVHDLDGPAVEECWSEDEWWLHVMERYYHLGGPLVDLGPPIDA